MSSATLPAILAVHRPADRRFSSLTVLTSPHQLQFPLRLSFPAPATVLRCPPIRMGGGPRTFPGGVSKWQWKRMQAKKAKQLLKARLLRERQIYEMRKRTELRAAVTELERPWEVVERGPTLFSVAADDQLKALADRFQRPGGFDMWSERDGPQLFRAERDGLPSARFFPKGAVHSVKPYGVEAPVGGDEGLRFDDWIARGGGGTRRRSKRFSKRDGGAVIDVEAKELTEGSGDPVEEVNSGGSSVRGISVRRWSFEEGNRFAGGGEEHGKNAGRGGNGRLGNGRMKDGRGSLRPTTNLYTAEKKAGRGSLGSAGDVYTGEMKAGRGSLHPTADMYSGETKAGRGSLRPGTGLHTRDMKAGRGSLRPGSGLHTRDMKAGRGSPRPGTDLFAREAKVGRGLMRPATEFYAREMKRDRASMRPTTDLYTGEMKARRDYLRPARDLYTGETKALRGSLRPIADVYAEDSGSRTGDSKWSGGNGSRRGNANGYRTGDSKWSGGNGSRRGNAGN